MAEFNLKDWITNTFGIRPIESESQRELKLLKNDSGEYDTWIAVYSNSFRDDDAVPEILSSAGHKRFVNRVDSGNLRLPELWLMHEPLWKYGEATFVAYDEVEPGITFAIAGGKVDEDKLHVSKAVAESDVRWKMSHTFFSEKRNNEDDSFDEWFTEEVSNIPDGKEANPLTGFGFIEGDKMITPQKRQEMQELLGVDAAFLDQLEASNREVANMAKEEREFKAKTEDEDTTAVTAEVESEEVQAEEEAEDVVEADATETEADAETAEATDEDGDVASETTEEVEPVVDETEPVIEPVTGFGQDLMSMMATSLKGIMAALEVTNTTLAAQQADIAELKELKGEIEELKEAKDKTPAANPNNTMAARMTYKSIMGLKDAEVEEGDELEEAGPEETKAKVQGGPLGSFIDSMVTGSRVN